MNLFKDKAFYKTLLVVAIPAAFQGLISLGVNMLDNVMVGSLGEVPLAAVALANQLSVIMSFVINGIGGGSAVLISQYLGKGDFAKIKRIFATVVQFAIAIALVIVTLSAIFPQMVMRIFTSDAALIAEGAKYVQIVCFSYFFFTVSTVLVAMFRWTEIVKIGLIISSISLVTNFIFNYALIYGKFGAPKMGTQGAALATVISRIVEMSVVLFYLFRVDKKIQMKLRDFFCFSKEIWLDFFRFGMPVVFGDVQWGVVGLVKAVLIGHMGVLMVAANSIADIVLSLAMIFTSGLANGAMVVIGKAVGAKDYPAAKKYAVRIQIMFAVIGVSMALLVILTRHIPPMFYNVSDEVKSMASTFLLIGGITHIGTCYHAACFTGINRGAGDGKFVMKVDMICGWLIVLPLTYLAGFVFKLPIPMVYLATRIDQCFKWIIAFFRLRGDKWIKSITK